MNPAPPVTSRLRTGEALKHAPQVCPPVWSGAAQFAPPGGLVEHAVGRAAGSGWKLVGAKGPNRLGVDKQPTSQRLLLHGDCKVVPTCHTGIGPVQDAVQAGASGRGPERIRNRTAPGGSADLIAHHTDRLTFPHESQHRAYEVAAHARVHPGSTHDEGSATTLPHHLTLALELGTSVDAERVRCVVW